MMLPTRMRVIAVVLMAVGSTACGYTLAGRGSALPAYIQAIGVPLFGNATTYFELEQIFTERVRSELIGRGRYRVVPDRVGVDGLLTGEITAVTLEPTSFTADQQAARYVVTVTARLELRDLQADTTIWQNPAMVFREEYEVATGTDVLDPTTFFGSRSNAVERLAADFAKTAVSAILEAF